MPFEEHKCQKKIRLHVHANDLFAGLGKKSDTTCGTLLKKEQLLWRQTVASGLCSRITHVLQQAMSVQRMRHGTRKERKNAHRASLASQVY